jgi:predicted lipid carrier protein YhbT
MRLPPSVRLFVDRVPLALTGKITEAVFAQVLRRHPGLFDRLGAHAGKSFRFIPDDLDLSFLVLPQHPRIFVTRKKPASPAHVTISGPLALLLALLEGRVDGDALFFARDLAIAGDMEAALALRNALDDSTIDLPRDIGGLAGPFAGIATRLAEAIRTKALTELA